MFLCEVLIERATFLKAGWRLLNQMDKFYLPLDKNQNLTAAAMEKQKE